MGQQLQAEFDLIIEGLKKEHQATVFNEARLSQELIDQRYKFQRLCKAANDLVELVEWHAYRGAESQRRLNAVKQTLKEFGSEGASS